MRHLLLFFWASYFSNICFCKENIAFTISDTTIIKTDQLDTLFFNFEAYKPSTRTLNKTKLENQIRKQLRKQEKHQRQLQKTNEKILSRIRPLEKGVDSISLNIVKPQTNKQLQQLEAYEAILSKEFLKDDYKAQINKLQSSILEEFQKQQIIEVALSKINFEEVKNLQLLKQLKIALDLKKNLLTGFENQDKLEGDLLVLVEKYKNSNNKNPYKNINSEEDLIKQGYQTKSQVQSSITSKNTVEDGNVEQFIEDKKKTAYMEQTEKLSVLKKNATDAQNSYMEIKKLKDLKINSLRTQLVDFKIKPVFSFNIQQRNIITGNNQLFLNLGLESQIFPKLKQGAGINNKFGFSLGKVKYFNLDLSYVYYYLNYDVVWGISLQAGYEYNFLHNMKSVSNEGRLTDTPFRDFLTNSNKNIAYLGLSKSYHINSKWNGTFLVGYDFFWKKLSAEKNSPWIIRLGFSRK